MARIRSIKPEFFTSEAIVSVPLSARLTFIGLWTYVDDNGVGPDNPRLILAAIYPLEDDPAEALWRLSDDLRSLSGARLIQRFINDGKRLLFVRSWDEHQKVSHPRKTRYARPLTCENVDPPEDLPRTPESLRREQGAGSREQGAGRTPLAHNSPAPTTPGRPVSGRRTGEPEGFAEWYAAYPLHKGRKAAATAYARARREVSAETLLTAARRLAADPTLDPTYAPHPTTWLNQGRWDDEGPARPASQQLNAAEQRQQNNLALVARFARAEHHQPQLGA